MLIGTIWYGKIKGDKLLGNTWPAIFRLQTEDIQYLIDYGRQGTTDDKIGRKIKESGLDKAQVGTRSTDGEFQIARDR